MLVAVDGVSVEGLGFDRTVRIIKQHASSSSSHQQQGQSQQRAVKNRPMTLRWREVVSWPPRDRVEVEAAGLELLVIDDFGGFRDLPLLNLAIGQMTAHADLGPGLPWRWLSLPPSARGGRFLASSRALKLDYYNRRIGKWEPLLEPCDMRCEVEAEDRGAAMVAAGGDGGEEVGDSARGEGGGLLSRLRGNTVVRASTTSEVNLTITEAAVEMLLRTAQEWSSSPPPPPPAALVEAVPPLSAPPLASANAHAMLPDAAAGMKLAGLGARNKAPFVFHNATGVPIAFHFRHPTSTSATAISSSTSPSSATSNNRALHNKSTGASSVGRLRCPCVGRIGAYSPRPQWWHWGE